MQQADRRTSADTGPRRGTFVSFEGANGAGKTTQAALLRSALSRAGYDTVAIREPGGTGVGERIRSILLDPALAGTDPVCELLLYEAARAQLVREVVAPALERGAVVISDRFADSTVAYQGFGRGIPVATVEALNRVACRATAPDRTVVLDIDPDYSWRRATSGVAADRIELEGAEFQRRVRDGFLESARKDPGRVRVVDASGDVGEVWARVRAELGDLFDLPETVPCTEVLHG